MNAMSLLDQLLKSGTSALGGRGASTGAQGAQGGLAGGLGDLARQVGLGGLLGQGGGNSGVNSGVNSGINSGSESHIGKYATGAAAGGLLGLLLGSKGGRGLGGAALKYGSVAAIGALAWRAYSDYQARQGAAAPSSQASRPAATRPAAEFAAAYAPKAPETAASFDALPPAHAEAHSRAMLKALIAGAKADGHFDDHERSLVEAELQRLDADPALRDWVQAELRRPVEPMEVAMSAASPEMAAEMYLASLLVVDEKTTMERAYLDALARELKLPVELKADLEARAAAA